MLPLTKRQREILDYLNEFIQQHGYAPSLEEIGRRFGLSSLATVHKHLTNLQEKGFIKRAWNRSRSVEMVPDPHRRPGGRAAAARLRRGRRPHRGRRLQRNDCRPRGPGRQARYLRAARPRRLDDRRADSRRRLRRRRGSEDRRQRRDGDRAASRDRRHAEKVLSRPRAAGSASSPPTPRCNRSSPTPIRCRSRASSSG